EFFSHTGASGGIDQVEAFELEPKQSYSLIVLGPRAELWDQREFRALEVERHRARLAVVSALDDKYIEQQKIWPELLKQKPDAILMVGDNVHVDCGSGTP